MNQATKITKDYDIIFDTLIENEREAIYKNLIEFFNLNDGRSNSKRLELFITNLNVRTTELIALKPYDFPHQFDEFILELIKSFPYEQNKENYKSVPIENFFKYEFLEIKNKFIEQIHPSHFNKELFNAEPLTILELMASYFAIQDFILKANTVKILARDRPEKVVERIIKSRGVVYSENILKQSEVNLITSQQGLIMYYIFSALNLNETTVGVKNTKIKIVEILTGKNLDNIKKFMVNPLKYKSTEYTIKDI